MTTPEPGAGVRQPRFALSPGSTEVLLVRHGESAPAQEGRPFALVDGHGDPELHPEGRLQAERVAERLAGAGLAALYVTTLRRTVETAAPLAARLGMTPLVEADLREVHLGEWEGGVLRHRVAAGDPLVLRLREEQRWDVIPGAEPAADFAARVRAALARVAAAHPGERVAAFTHGGVIGEVLAQASGSRSLAFSGADNGSISHVVITVEGWVVRSYNDTSHLVPPTT